jgi:hypothetical protein
MTASFRCRFFDSSFDEQTEEADDEALEQSRAAGLRDDLHGVFSDRAPKMTAFHMRAHSIALQQHAFAFVAQSCVQMPVEACGKPRKM